MHKTLTEPLSLALLFGTFIAAVDALFTMGLANDLTEATFWGQELVSVTDKHPAGFGLIHYFWAVLFSYNEFAVLMLGVVNFVFCVWLLWNVLKELGWPIETRAVPIFLALASFNSYLFLIKYNGNSAPAPFWLITMLLLLRLQKRPNFLLWIVLGATCAFAMFMKYQTVLLLMTIFGFALTSPKTRQWFKSSGPYIAMASFLIFLLPHAIEMARNDFPGLSYGISNVTSSSLNPFVSRILSPAKFTLIQILFALPGLAVALYWYFRKCASVKLDDDSRRFLFWFGFVFPVSPCLISIITGGEIGDIWGVGASFLIIPFILSRREAVELPSNAFKVAQRTAAITFVIFGFLFLIAQPLQVHSNPKQKVASAVEAELAEMRLAPPKFVISRSHSASSLNYYMASHPLIIRGESWSSQPWTTEKRQPSDTVLIQVTSSEIPEEVAVRHGVRMVHVFEINIPAVGVGFSKHDAFSSSFVYGVYDS